MWRWFVLRKCLDLVMDMPLATFVPHRSCCAIAAPSLLNSPSTRRWKVEGGRWKSTCTRKGTYMYMYDSGRDRGRRVREWGSSRGCEGRLWSRGAICDSGTSRCCGTMVQGWVAPSLSLCDWRSPLAMAIALHFMAWGMVSAKTRSYSVLHRQATLSRSSLRRSYSHGNHGNRQRKAILQRKICFDFYYYLASGI